MKYLLIILSVLTFVQIASSKNTGDISGFVLDSKTAQSLIAVNVIVDNTNYGTITDIDGFFKIGNLPSGVYNLKFSMMGYNELIKLNVDVRNGNQTNLNVELIPSVLKMDAVTVLAPAFQKSKGAVVSERSIDLGELRSDPGAQMDIQRSVQVLPSVSSGSDQMNEIIVRGGEPGENLFVMDEIEIPNPNHFGVPGTGGGPVNLINAEFVQKIDFYAGAFPAKYGDKASSVMNIQFREGSREQRQITADLGMAGVGMSMEGPISNKGSYLITAHKSYLDLIVSSIGLTAVPVYGNMQGKFVYRLSDKNKLTVNAVYGADGIEIDNTEDDTWSRGAEYVDVNGYLYAIGSTLLTNWNKTSYSKITAYRNEVMYGYDVDKYITETRKRDFHDAEIVEAETAVKLFYSKNFTSKTDLQTGFQIKNYSGNTDMWTSKDTLFAYNPDGSIVAAVKTFDESHYTADITGTKLHAFMSFSWYALPKLKAVTGLRINYFTENEELTYSPRLGLSYTLHPALSLNAGFGRHFQTPDLGHIITNNEQNMAIPFSKYTDQYIIGIDYFPVESIKITVEAFRKNYEDYPVPDYWIETQSDTSRSDMYFINEGVAHSTGLEFFLHKKLFDSWYTILSYSISKTEALDLRYDEWYPRDYDYGHIFNFVGGYRFLKTESLSLPIRILSMGSDIFTMSMRYRYMGGRPYTKPTYYEELRNWYVDESHYNTERYPAYQRLDLAFQWKAQYKKIYMSSYLNIQNILNIDNIWDYMYNDDGTIDEVLQYQTMPVGGFIIEF